MYRMYVKKSDLQGKKRAQATVGIMQALFLIFFVLHLQMKSSITEKVSLIQLLSVD